MSKETLTFGVELEQGDGYEFRVRFDTPDAAELLLDEPLSEKRGELQHQSRKACGAASRCP